eukprot:Sspe_Gene.49406::Locus_26607_Transcript_2_2_Confidence_0.750_Length_525::g.49406::m.49406
MEGGNGLDQKGLLLTAFLVVLAALMNIFACTVVGDTLWPLLILVVYIFSPLPLFLCVGNSQSDIFGSSGSGGFGPLAHFLVGLFAASGPCLTIVLAHTGTIGGAAAAFSLMGGALFAAAVYLVRRGKQEDMSF